MKNVITTFLMTFLFSSLAYGEKNSVNTIKDILMKDHLLKESDQKKIEELKLAAEREKKEKSNRKILTDEEFSEIATLLWLVKRESKLKWDFKKVDYGVNFTFKKLLKKLNISGPAYKILYLNSDIVPHLGLLAGRDYILLISKTFIEKLDLSKQEISLILLEEYLRLKLNLLHQKISKKVTKVEVKNRNSFEEYWGILDEEIIKIGFSFQEQFNLTKETVNYIKQDAKISEMYQRLNDKIKLLIEGDSQYSFYSKIYPSPDLKETWLAKLLPLKKI